MRLPLLILCGWAATSACAANQPSMGGAEARSRQERPSEPRASWNEKSSAASLSAPGVLRRLSGVEIRGLIEGRSLSFVDEPDVLRVTSHYQEVYRSDGSLFIRGDRGGTPGRYTIAADRICLTLATNATRCRHVLTSDTGELYVQPIESSRGPVRVRIND